MTCFQIILLSWKVTLNGVYQSHLTVSYLCTFSSPLSNLKIVFNICLKYTYRSLEHRQHALLWASRKILLVLASCTLFSKEMNSKMWLCKWCEMGGNSVCVNAGTCQHLLCVLFWVFWLQLRPKCDLDLFGSCFCLAIQGVGHKRKIYRWHWV